MNRPALLAFIAALLAAPAAQACDYIDYRPELFWIPAGDMAKLLHRRAASVEVAVAESAELVGPVPWHEEIAYSRVTFQVVERLKGRGHDRFTLTGLVTPADAAEASPEALASLIGERGDFADPELIYMRKVREASEWRGGAACEDVVRVVIGRRYLVFRDDRGRLVEDAIPMRIGWDLEGEGSTQGAVFEPVGGDSDPCLAKVRATSRAWQAEIERLKAGN